MMKLDKEKFLRTELGTELYYCIKSWDIALDGCAKYPYDSEEYKEMRWIAARCQAQWEVYKLAIRQFYGIDYSFFSINNHFGIMTKDGSDWLFREERC